MNRNKVIKILFIILAVIGVIYLTAKIYSITARTYKTEVVTEQTVLETIDAEMFVIRDETILTVSSSGVTVPLAENGERVSKGSAIAATFSSEAAAENYVEAQALENKLQAYQKIDGQLRLANIDLDKLTDEIDSEFASILDSVYNNDFSDLSDLKLSFSEKISRKQISLDQAVDCSAEIAELQNLISALNSGGTPSEIINAEISGYYVSKEDGYENILTVSDIETLTAEQLEEALKSEKKDATSGSIGKIIDGYNWYVAAIVDSTQAKEFSDRKNVRLIFGDSDEDTVTTYLHSVETVNEKESLVIFRCNLMNERLTSLRKIEGKIVVSEYKGLKVRRDAIRLDENGNEGVYVRLGNTVDFRCVYTIYSEDSFIIASEPDSKKVSLPKTHLKQYDEVIISGKELRDGMVI